jgi:peptide/nickel transport system permease protein
LTAGGFAVALLLAVPMGIAAAVWPYSFLNHDYVRTARAKGLGERLVIGRHAVRNALIPVVTILGLQIGAFMGGAVITESVFDWPGLGRAFWNAVLNRDYNVVQAIVLFVVLAFILVNLVTDLVCAALDPRIRIK